jgi:hypothetical protein
MNDAILKKWMKMMHECFVPRRLSAQGGVRWWGVGSSLLSSLEPSFTVFVILRKKSMFRATPVGGSIWASTLKFGGFGQKNQLQ